MRDHKWQQEQLNRAADNAAAAAIRAHRQYLIALQQSVAANQALRYYEKQLGLTPIGVESR